MEETVEEYNARMLLEYQNATKLYSDSLASYNNYLQEADLLEEMDKKLSPFLIKEGGIQNIRKYPHFKKYYYDTEDKILELRRQNKDRGVTVKKGNASYTVWDNSVPMPDRSKFTIISNRSRQAREDALAVKPTKPEPPFYRLGVITPSLVSKVKAPDTVKKVLPFHIVNSISKNGEFKVGPTAKGRGGNRDMSEDGSHNLQIRLPNGRDGERNVISTTQLNQYVQDGLIEKDRRGRYKVVKSKKSMKMGGKVSYNNGGKTNPYGEPYSPSNALRQTVKNNKVNETIQVGPMMKWGGRIKYN